MVSDPITVFFSYSHRDEDMRDELAKHLAILRRNNLITDWYDRDITAGAPWEAEILNQLEQANVILLLISSDFLASDFCWNIELKKSIARHDKGDAVVIPIILRDVDWKDAPFGKLQALPKNAQPVATWPTQDAAFKDITQGIRKAVTGLQRRRQQAKQQKLDQYETAYQQAIEQQYPLPADQQAQLERLQEALALTTQDIAPIKAKLNSQVGEAHQRLEKYRQEVHHCLEADGGNLSPISSTILQAFRGSFGITEAEAEAIEQAEIAPYEKKRQGLEQYESVLQAALQQETPLSEKTRKQMKRLQMALKLEDSEVQGIELKLQQGIEQQQAEQERRVAEERRQQEQAAAAAADDLSSEQGIDYTRLRGLLKAGDWEAADRETYEVMIRAVGKKSGDWFTKNELLNFPCADLLTIDSLWVKYSQGRFGFSVQKKIYVECGGKLDGKYPGDEIWDKFCDRVGWMESNSYIYYKDVTFDTSAPSGHLPSTEVPLVGGLVLFVGYSFLASRLVKCKASGV